MNTQAHNRARTWEIDWSILTARRRRLLETDADMPPYLVLPEIEALLDAALDWRDRMMLDTVWHTGARVSELLALRAGSFHLDEPGGAAFVTLATLKQRGRGRPRAADRAPAPKRLVPLTDPAYLDQLRRFVATWPPSGALWPISRWTVANRLRRVAARVALPVAITPHTLRHSFAINCILHGVPVRVLQAWLGHARSASTERYTRVLGTETGHFMRVVRYSEARIAARETFSRESTLSSREILHSMQGAKEAGFKRSND